MVSTSPKKYQTQPSASKITATVFWDSDGLLRPMITTCLLQRQLLDNVMENSYFSYTMSSSRNVQKSWHLGVWLLHDNAPVHKSVVA